ncbi:sodium- and chloride-dependent transporter XTRP3A [Eurytemora carolleeae]|uniref:sodium- and chloride-dependent transporter XTRP3A n=1 Tax=Eurytemora carolleeae TaxID=1294199 RepID=UPI000C778D06|nr:sodium- and chloride-dependent transporter XTRP3A [Eurytemora carolleeae]XP_023345215.1 sodium- and chloride-dependent transporter XTRP3A [Eurytemora carolleeae]|eukprot:XP_023345214.1 sodium- and chloride-dependent transporter XTRP3A-like [Eurytemora affinis]
MGKEVRLDIDDTRMTWDSPVQFFFTILGFCVGLGNIWRFPYLCQKHGGGAFVIPFMIMIVLVGMPLLLLELGLGQKLRVGSAAAWPKIHPALSGVGYGSSVVAVIVGCYYNVIIAWCLNYLFSSFTSELPWTKCPQDYITGKNITECMESSETQYFWFRTTLASSDSIENFDGINWKILMYLTLSWIMVYLILMKGIASSGKVVYFTAMFPYVVLTIFFFRGLTLQGALIGLQHMLTPKLEKLLEPTVWLDAANQVFYSFGLAFGSIISFGSYNNPKKNCVRDVLMISLTNICTAIYACAVIFSILGFKAVTMLHHCMEHDISILSSTFPEFIGRNIEDIPQEEYDAAILIMHSSLNPSHNSSLVLNSTLSTSLYLNNSVDPRFSLLRHCSLKKELDSAAGGTGLAFIVMAEVFTQIPLPPLWSILFFLMLLSLGVGSQIGILEGVTSTLFDHPRLKFVKKPILVGAVALFSFCIGTVFTTGAGEYWLTLFDEFGATGLTLIAFIEIICVMYVYGHRRFTDDIEDMTGYRPGIFWQVLWRLISPLLMLSIILSSAYSMFTKHPTYTAWNKEKAMNEEKEYPPWALVIAAILAVASLIPIAGGVIIWWIQGCRGNSGSKYSPGAFHRVDTNASTRPMMDGFEETRHDVDRISYRSSDSESDGGIIQESSRPKNFKMEVLKN